MEVFGGIFTVVIVALSIIVPSYLENRDAKVRHETEERIRREYRPRN